MGKVQYDKHNDRYHITIPKSKVKAYGWDERIENGEDVELDVSTLPDQDGFSAREIK